MIGNCLFGWLEREVGFRTSTRRYGAVHRKGVPDVNYMVDAGGFEPPATWLQTRCSSKMINTMFEEIIGKRSSKGD